MGFFSSIFNKEDNDFDQVKIDQEVIDSVIYYSKKSYPNEFLSLFDGFIKDKTLYIIGLIFLPGETCETGAVFHKEMIPMTTKHWGSVHSHPGPSARPSDADLYTFSKNGLFHMIVCLPYSVETFKAYDKYGNEMDYTIGDYSDIIQEEYLCDFFDEDDIVKDDEIVKAGFFDEEDIIEDEEEVDRYSQYEKEFNNQNNNVHLDSTVVKGSLMLEIDSNGNLVIKPLNNEKK
ncbi:MAG: Mov34/MPN/PAD-1 family protein [archaeon]|nr:Mov34/MPN/PAD-1 family protein [archaeon]